ncbi:DUF6928 family protein [Corynebacterium renale]|uniref:Uncharacterized protein n=1 Tax=Corynebacterium renale TaxID=1724 RepID=A0A2A9DJU1_9CORY|nr:hypothetical protein [Corynebacterium renale]PFG27017.1 hypothetical protein ATK06_0059 [Corynebacterium renale]SQI24441.1 Uncharacterised protein [Corynebacterium renale]
MTMFGFPPQAGTEHKATVTIWFINTDDPAAILSQEPDSDRGFGRKYLAQLQPGWPVTPIGDFPMNRSTPAGDGEFYIAAYPHITVMQTVLEGVEKITHIDQRIIGSLPHTELVAISRNPETGLGGFVRIVDGEVERAFSATREHIYKDIGLPQPFEAEFWAGEDGTETTGIQLPFHPIHMASAAEDYWLGLEISPDGIDVNISAFAVDGRPAPKLAAPETTTPLGELVQHSAAALGLSEGGNYDDYEVHDRTPSSGDEFARLAEASAAAMKRVRRGVVRRAKSAAQAIGERIRHADRP